MDEIKIQIGDDIIYIPSWVLYEMATRIKFDCVDNLRLLKQSNMRQDENILFGYSNKIINFIRKK